MRSSRIRTLQSRLHAASSFAGLFAVLAAIPCVAAPPAAWQALWNNQNNAARAAFKADPRGIDSPCGLALVDIERDAPGAVVADLSPLYQNAPASWQASVYWPIMADMAEQSGKWPQLTSAARSILRSPNAPPELVASARQVLAESLARTGDFAGAAKQWAALGYMTRWRVIGPFDNVSKSGFDKAYAPESGIDFGATCRGKDDMQLSWHTLATVDPDGLCEVGASVGDKDADVYYAVTAVRSTAPQNVCLRLNPSGATKVYVNGHLCFSDDVYRAARVDVADMFAVPVTLNAGWNTILVKLADDKDVSACFALRLTPASSGEPLALACDPAKSSSAAVDSVGSPNDVAAPSATCTLGALLKTKGVASDPQAAFTLAHFLYMTHDYDGAAGLLRGALAIQPQSGLLHWELAQTLKDDDQVDEARAERDEALKDDTDLIAARLDQLSDQEETMPSSEYIAKLKALTGANRQSASVYWAIADAYDDIKLTGESINAAQMATQVEPGSENIAEFAEFCDDRERTQEAESAVARALKTAPYDDDLLNEQASLLSDSDDTAGAIAADKRELKVDPTSPYIYIGLGDLYESQKQPSLAAGVLEIARQQRPQDADICASLGDELDELGKTKQAAAIYANAVALDPSKVELREKEQLLSGEKPVIDLAPATPSGTLLAAAKSADAQGASALVLLDEGREVVYPDYATLCKFHQIIKIADQSAARRYQDFELGLPTSTASATVESARVIKADGKVQDMTDQADEDSVPFPSLAPGDIIDVAWRVEDYQRGDLAGQFWSSWFFANDEAVAVHSRFVLITPAKMTYQIRAHGAVPQSTVKEAGSWQIREWRASNVAAFKPEVMGTPRQDASPWIDISTVPSWSTIVHWYRGLSGPICEPDATIRAKAEALTKNATTEDEKIHALVAYVRAIQYQSTPFRLSAYIPTEGKQVMREGYGDCKDKAALLTALLAAVGIKAHMALLSPRDEGITPFLPSPRFNHAIACVDTSHGPMWIDATADQMQYGDLPAEDQQVPALLIDDSTSDLTLTPALAVENTQVVQTHTASLTEDGDLKDNQNWTLTGDVAWMLRTVFKQIPKDKDNEALRQMASELSSNAVYDGGSLGALDDPDTPFTMNLQFHVDHYGAIAGNFLLAKLPWAEEDESRLEAALQDPSRTQDVEISDARADSKTMIDLTLPAGYAPQDLQPDVSADSPWGSYHMTYSFQGSVLHATREVKLTALRVPFEDIPKFVAFIKAMDEETDKQIVYKKT